MARRLAVTAETWPIQGTFRIARGGKTHAEVIVATIRDDAGTVHGGVIGREIRDFARHRHSIAA